MTPAGIFMAAMFSSGVGAFIGFALGVRAGDKKSRAIEAYKLVSEKFEDFIHGGAYAVGAVVAREEIFAGTRQWVRANYEPGMIILLIRFQQRDVIEPPAKPAGQYRVARCKVLRGLDPRELGL